MTGLWDRMVASDPGLLRLILALRGTCSVFIMTIVVIVMARLLGASPVELASGVVFSIMAPFLTREATVRQRQQTLLLLPLPAAGATIATTLLHGHGLAGEAFFVLLVFAACLLQARSPRGIALGLVAVVVSYVGLYLELPPATLPLQLLAILVAVPVVWLACFVILPFRPAATLRRTVQAVQGRAALVLREARALAGAGPGETRTDRAVALRRSLARLNEAALAADDQLALLYPAGSAALRLHLMDLELATARLAALPAGSLAGHAGRQQSARLRAQERRLHRGRWSRHQLRKPGAGGAGSVVAAALADISRAAAALGAAISAPPAAPAVQPPPPGPLAWRMALRVTIASVIAMAGGMALSPQRWFWAVITVYVVFLGTRTRGDAIFRGVQRLGGTLMGLFAGLTLAALLTGLPIVQAVVLLGAVFGMYYLILVSYTLGIFCVTVLLGLIYSLLGASMGSLLLLRLEETAIGAAAAIFVALVVVPVRTREQVGRSGAGVLRALAQVVGTCRRVLAGEADAAPVPAMRAVDRQVADLRLALLPLVATACQASGWSRRHCTLRSTPGSSAETAAPLACAPPEAALCSMASASAARPGLGAASPSPTASRCSACESACRPETSTPRVWNSRSRKM